MINADEKQEQDPAEKIDPIRQDGDGTPSEAVPPPKATDAKADPEKHLSSSLKEMFVQVTEKGEKMVKSGAAAVGDFTAHAAHQAKLKLEIHNLRNNLEKRYQEAGEKLWQLHKQGELNDIEAAFSNHFKRMAAIEESLKKKEAEAEGKAEALTEEKP